MDKTMKRNRRVWIVLLSLLVAVCAAFTVACGGGGDDEDPKPNGPTLSSATLQLGEGESATLTVSPAAGADESVVWKSSDESVVSVVGGEVTAHRAGTATVTCTIGDAEPLSCVVTVTEAKYRLSFTALALSTLAGSNTAKIEVYDGSDNIAGGV